MVTDVNELLTRMAGLAVLQKRINLLMDEMKTEYAQIRTPDDPYEPAQFGGVNAASVYVTRDREGSYMVDDPLAYGEFLHKYGFDCNGQPGWRTVAYPTDTAMEGTFLQALIDSHGGAIPAGVSWHEGRHGGVTVRLNKNVISHVDPVELSDTALEAAGTPIVETVA